MKEKNRFKYKQKFYNLLLLFFMGTIGMMAQTIAGTLNSKDGPMPGASVSQKGTSNGVVTDFDGKFKIRLAEGEKTLVFSYIGYKSVEVIVGNETVLDVIIEEDTETLDEVVIVGYGTQKKVNLTGAVSVVGKEALTDRPVANVQQALQGASPNLQITTSDSSGEPGASMNMSIRGLTSLEGDSSPFVLIDGIPMDINDIDPNDIESISILKDVAASAIYGARAAYGVILITTKNGVGSKGVKVSYSTNFAITSLLNMPQNADALSFAHTMNHSSINAGGSGYFDTDALNRIAQNMAEPGSAPGVLPTADGLNWDIGVQGLNSSDATDWESVLFKKNSYRKKHNISLSGGNEDISFYLAGGFYDEDGMLKIGNDFFKRYNLDAKIHAKISSWMKVSLLTKYNYEEQEYPTHPVYGRSYTILEMTRLKPTKPLYYPGTDVYTGTIGEQEVWRGSDKYRQLVFSPRLTLEPIKNWITNVEVNYRTNDNSVQSSYGAVAGAVPDGTGGSIITYSNQANTAYDSNLYTNTYLSPNIYTNYNKSFGNHNFGLMMGYQHETYSYSNLMVQANYLLSGLIPSISTSVGEVTSNFSSDNDEDEKGHWSTQGVFGRFNYNYKEKYLFEMNVRRDGSSRFEPDSRWGTFPSFSAGWVFSKESFYPLKDQIDFFKIRGSYGSIGNQNVDNYLYVPTMSVSQSSYLFGGEPLWTVGLPNISSVDLTWEKVTTMDFGLDIKSFNNRLALTFDWYESRTNNLVGPGQVLPVILGAEVPKVNAGEITTRGWELELSWQNTSGDFNYGITGALSDYKSKITQYNNPTNILTTYYEGMDIGEIWGLETSGLFQSVAEVDDWTVDQSYLYSGEWLPGDVRYLDQNNNNVLDIGDNTKDNPGDKKVIGNNTPRYQFGFTFNAGYKGFDVSFLVQGVGKRDLDLRGLGTFRGPANGPLHANVYTEHLDFWRDETSPLGANPDGYFPNAYSQYTGQNEKNYGLPTTRYLQNGAYVRLKNAQIGFTLPKGVSDKIKISKARIYLSGENLLTFTDLMIFDPEAFSGRQTRVGDQYPLSQVFSLGLNVNF
ncbi:SusC/RagA family TonB-linked outer membrane protein [Formosa undariae]|uniref:SusC/RagA family TonB-linked outer membrane protein n=1 Tax=Formosa undariae TaxID=1325436 RepID=A0ABV5F6S8_9FLAO